jgi:metal-dependent hydrolase (beta-lactamase superfamily II)
VTQIIGGLHLVGVAERDLQRVGARLAAMSALTRVSPSHCTGEAAFLALAGMLGAEMVRSSPAGTVIEIA